jgi:putative hemolysin
MLPTPAGHPAVVDYPACPGSLPPGTLASRRYRARFARSAHELDIALRLRFDVFNVELGEGLASSYETRRDLDEYDPGCHHLLVSRGDTPDAVVGTYRMQTSTVADRHLGFYSASEFDLSRLPRAIVEDAVEVGRACVAAEHRNTQVLFLLWRGLARYVAFNQKRYLFGCCSVSTQDEAAGWSVMRQLERGGHVDHRFEVAPLEPFALPAASVQLADGGVEAPLPPLMRLYLRYGARVLGMPAIDRRFGTVDFFVLFDVASLTEERFRNFFGEADEG